MTIRWTMAVPRFAKDSTHMGAVPESLNGIPWFVRLTVAIAIGLILCELNVVSIARLGDAQQVFEPSAALLPGKYFDAQSKCIELSYRTKTCIITQIDKHISVFVDTLTGTIHQTFYRPDHLTIGALITAWGTPAETSRCDDITYFYWEFRIAYVDSQRFGLNSLVHTITYNLEASAARLPLRVAWHGFTNHYNIADTQ